MIWRWRITARSYFQPNYFIEPEDLPENFSIEDWSQSFNWDRDPWRGYKDSISPIEETVHSLSGDCDDYAAVAATWAIENDRDGVGFGYLWKFPTPWPVHMIAFDEDYVYSSGWIFNGSLDEWIERSGYTHCRTRKINTSNPHIESMKAVKEKVRNLTN